MESMTMVNKKNKPWYLRLLGSISAFVLLGSVLYVFFTGFNLVSSALLVAGVSGLVVPAVVSGDTFFEMVLGGFEAFFDGIMEVVGGIFDFISSIFG